MKSHLTGFRDAGGGGPGDAATFSRSCKSISVLLLAPLPVRGLLLPAPRPGWCGFPTRFSGHFRAPVTQRLLLWLLGQGKKKKKRKKKREGKKKTGGWGKKKKKKKKKPSKNKTGIRQRGVSQSRCWGPCDSPLPVVGQIRRSGAFGLLGRVVVGENGGEDAENKTPPGACRSPPPLRIKKPKNQVK